MGFGAPYDEGELFAGLAAEQWAELLWMLQLAGFAPADLSTTGDFTPAAFGPAHTDTLVVLASKH